MDITLSFELALPICAFVFSLLLAIVYFSKERVKLLENEMYSVMLICVLVDSILVIIEKMLVVGKTIEALTPFTIFILGMFNKFDATSLLILTTCLSLYIYTVSFKMDRHKFKRISIIALIVILTFTIAIFLLKFKLISNNGIISVSGSFLYPTYIGCGLNIIVSIIFTLLNFKNLNRKYIPLFITLIVFSFLIFLFTYNPYLTVISICLTFINYVMYFTIENPDAKMINELEYAKTRAEKSNRAKSDFLSSMSHEIRTPLNAVVGFSEDISDNIDDKERVKEDSDYIQEASKNLLEIVGNILDINKIESGKMDVENKAYNLREEIIPLANMDAKRIKDKPTKFNINIENSVPNRLIGDNSKLKEIVNNLLTNAIKYTEVGSINLNIDSELEDDTCKLIITIEDTGKGIKEENIDKLFTKFERLDAPVNSDIEGTGLGLAITKELVELLNGEITVKSEYGKGSTFKVILPQKINTEVKMTTIVFHRAEDSKKENINRNIVSTNKDAKKILIVDDNKLNIKVAEKSLIDLNLNIDTASSGKETIEKVNNNKYDLILMDIMMPEMGGEECLENLKKLDNFNTPVIAVTADAVEGAKEKYLNVGFVDYLAKPFKKEDIIKKVKNNLSTNDDDKIIDN